jgi:two-component system chemotaxis sensor kinase CheA
LHSKYRTELDKKESAIQDLQVAQEKLKEYSLNLEEKVEVRTIDLARKNQLLTAMVNSLGQAFILLDENGICSKTYSLVTLKLLETDPSQKNIAQVLKIPPEQTASFKSWIKLLFEERVSFETLVNLGPKTFAHSQGRHIALEFHPVRQDGKKLTGLVVVATDKTGEIEALKQAEQEQQLAKRVIKLAKYKDLFWHFVASAEKSLTELEVFLRDPDLLCSNVEKILRAAHTLKGEASQFWVTAVAQDMHEFETLIKVFTSQNSNSRQETIQRIQALLEKVKKDLKDFLKENATIVGEYDKTPQRHIEVSYEKLQTFGDKLQFNKTLAKQFEDEFLKESLGKFIEQYDDMALSLARQSGKSVHPIIMKGKGIRILVEGYREVLSSLVHLITNAVTHGIETPEVRLSREKDTAGTISVNIAEGREEIQIVVQDDGNGIDPTRIRKRMSNLGVTLSQKETDEEVIQHIFDPAFSTSENLSPTAGRGMGLNALFNAVKAMGGQIQVRSSHEKWTQFIIILPLKKNLQAA